jgi:hypothetical protein
MLALSIHICFKNCFLSYILIVICWVLFLSPWNYLRVYAHAVLYLAVMNVDGLCVTDASRSCSTTWLKMSHCQKNEQGKRPWQLSSSLTSHILLLSSSWMMLGVRCWLGCLGQSVGYGCVVLWSKCNHRLSVFWYDGQQRKSPQLKRSSVQSATGLAHPASDFLATRGLVGCNSY